MWRIYAKKFSTLSTLSIECSKIMRKCLTKMIRYYVKRVSRSLYRQSFTDKSKITRIAWRMKCMHILQPRINFRKLWNRLLILIIRSSISRIPSQIWKIKTLVLRMMREIICNWRWDWQFCRSIMRNIKIWLLKSKQWETKPKVKVLVILIVLILNHLFRHLSHLRGLLKWPLESLSPRRLLRSRRARANTLLNSLAKLKSQR